MICYRLNDAKKDALLMERAALIEHMVVRVAEFEAAINKPKKTSSNSHRPLSQVGPCCKNREKMMSLCAWPMPVSITQRRAKSVAEEVLVGHRPDVWIADRYAGLQDLAQIHLACLAHVLRDVRYAIDRDDSVFIPKIRDRLRRAIRVGKRRGDLTDTRYDKLSRNYVATLQSVMSPSLQRSANLASETVCCTIRADNDGAFREILG